MTRRIFFKEYDSTGEFPDGRVKLDIYFRDSQGNAYVWTPKWEKGVRNLFLEAYRVESLNRLNGQEVEVFRQTAKELLSEDRGEVKSYREIYGRLDRLEEGQIIVQEPILEKDEPISFFSFLFPSKVREWRVPISIDFQAKVLEETKKFVNWVRRYRGCSGKWEVVDGKLFDVEWDRAWREEDKRSS